MVIEPLSLSALTLSEGGWLVLVLVAPGLLALVAVVVAFIVRPRSGLHGPGYYHILGFDKASGARRELTVHADSQSAARWRAELDGIVVTEVTQVHESH